MFFVRTCYVGRISVLFAGIKQVEKVNANAVHAALKYTFIMSPFLFRGFTVKLLQVEDYLTIKCR